MPNTPINVLLTVSQNDEELALLNELTDPRITVTMDRDADDYHVLIGGKVDDDLLTRSPNLQSCIVPFAGIPDSYKTHFVKPEYSHISIHNSHYHAGIIAEYMFGLMFTAAKNHHTLDRHLRNGDWRIRYKNSRGVLLQGKTVLVLGYGAIGRNFAKLCRAIGMNIKAIRRHVSEPTERDGVIEYPASMLHDLLPDADVLMSALPLTAETEGLIGKAELALLPGHAIVLNVGRGKVFDEEALYTALRDGVIHAAGLDVWYHYPTDEETRVGLQPSSYPFNELENVVMSPHHSAALADRADLRVRMVELARVLNIFANGERMPNELNLELGY